MPPVVDPHPSLPSSRNIFYYSPRSPLVREQTGLRVLPRDWGYEPRLTKPSVMREKIAKESPFVGRFILFALLSWLTKIALNRSKIHVDDVTNAICYRLIYTRLRLNFLLCGEDEISVIQTRENYYVCRVKF